VDRLTRLRHSDVCADGGGPEPDGAVAYCRGCDTVCISDMLLSSSIHNSPLTFTNWPYPLRNDPDNKFTSSFPLPRTSSNFYTRPIRIFAFKEESPFQLTCLAKTNLEPASSFLWFMVRGPTTACAMAVRFGRPVAWSRSRSRIGLGLRHSTRLRELERTGGDARTTPGGVRSAGQERCLDRLLGERKVMGY